MSTSVMSMELPQSLARSGVMPLYAVVGEEDYLRDSSVAALRTAALGAGAESGFNYDIFHGDDSSIADVLACAAEIPVFAERRVVVYKSVEKLPAREGEKLLSYLASPNETTTFIVVGAKLDGRLKWTQALTKRAVTVNCAPCGMLSSRPGFDRKRPRWVCACRRMRSSCSRRSEVSPSMQ